LFTLVLSIVSYLIKRELDYSFELPAHNYIGRFVSLGIEFLFSVSDLLNGRKLFKQMLRKNDEVLDVDDSIAPGHGANVT